MKPLGTIAILGGGKMGEALVSGLLDSGAARRDRLWASDVRRERLVHLAKKYRIRTDASNAAVAARADVLLVAVKPAVMKDVLEGIRDAIGERQLVISIAAGVTTAQIERHLAKPVSVVRAMPNTPCLVREGMTAVCAGRYASPRHLETARAVFASVGRCIVLEEKHLDAVTAVSGSGPAFQFVILDALADGGVKAGLPRDVAVVLAAQTMRGAAAMVLGTGQHPGTLKDAVATPGGCTVEGLLELEEGGVRATLIKAVVRAARRAGELAGEK
jgi:pyrroline-5-carboxylate reductase